MKKSARKQVVLAAAVLLSVILFGVLLNGCKEKGGYADESEGPEYIIPMRASASDDYFSLQMIIRDCTANRVVMNLYDGDAKKVGSVQRDISVTKQQGTNLTLELERFKNKLSGNVRAEVLLYGKIDADNKLNEEPLDRAVIQFKDYVVQLGSDSVNCVVAAMNTQEKAELVIGHFTQTKREQDAAAAETASFEKYGIPSITIAEGAAGLLLDEKSVSYPSASVLGNSWNPSLTEKVGAAIGREAKYFNIDVVIAPTLNIRRSVSNGKQNEFYSEDPLLAGYLGAAFVNGLQSERVGAAIGDFAVGNQNAGTGTVSANVSERALREIYLTGFELAVRNSSPYTVISSANRLNGVSASVSKDLLSAILRSEWGYRGFVMSDWSASGDAAERIASQNDFSVSGNGQEAERVTAAIENGTLREEELDRCCINILRVVVKSNTFNGRNGGEPDFETGTAISREAASEGAVLLKNQKGTLPAAGKHAVLYGESGDVDFTAAFRQAGFTVVDYMNQPASRLHETKLSQEAADNDFAVLCISREAGDAEFLLREEEQELITLVSEKFHNAGKKIIVLLYTGNPVEVVSWRDQADAILYLGLAGEETGAAAADLIAGKTNPSGKLTFSYPVSYSDTPAEAGAQEPGTDVTYAEDIYVGYRFYESFDAEAAYPFGYGLSYTAFTYSDVSVSSSIYTDSLSVTVCVTNTGKAAGREIVQLYVQKPETDSFKQPETVLASFAKTDLLKPGESQTVTLTVNQYSLRSFHEESASWNVGEGLYTAYVAPSVKDTGDSELRFRFRVENNITLQAVDNRCTAPESLELFQP